jgi:hypothetical protein
MWGGNEAKNASSAERSTSSRRSALNVAMNDALSISCALVASMKRVSTSRHKNKWCRILFLVLVKMSVLDSYFTPYEKKTTQRKKNKRRKGSKDKIGGMEIEEGEEIVYLQQAVRQLLPFSPAPSFLAPTPQLESLEATQPGNQQKLLRHRCWTLRHQKMMTRKKKQRGWLTAWPELLREAREAMRPKT